MDLGLFVQQHWLLSRGLVPFNTVMGMHMLADHMDWIDVLVAPLLRLGPGPEMLLLVQSLVVASAVFPLVALGSASPESTPGWPPPPRVVLAPDVHMGVMFDYNPSTLGSALLLWAAAAIVLRGPLAAVGFPLLACAAKENFTLYVAMLGFTLALMRLDSWRRGSHGRRAGPLALRPAARGPVPPLPRGGFRHWEFEELGETPKPRSACPSLSHPLRTAELLVDNADKRRGLLLPLLGTGYLGVAEPATLLLLLPNWGERFLSTHRTRWWGYYYGMPAVALACLGTARRVATAERRPARTASGCPSTCSAACCWRASFRPTGRRAATAAATSTSCDSRMPALPSTSGPSRRSSSTSEAIPSSRWPRSTTCWRTSRSAVHRDAGARRGGRRRRGCSSTAAPIRWDDPPGRGCSGTSTREATTTSPSAKATRWRCDESTRNRRSLPELGCPDPEPPARGGGGRLALVLDARRDHQHLDGLRAAVLPAVGRVRGQRHGVARAQLALLVAERERHAPLEHEGELLARVRVDMLAALAAGPKIASTGSSLRLRVIEPSASRWASVQVLSSRRRSDGRTIRSSSASLAVAAKNSPRVTPSVSAIFCSDPSEGDTWPFSSCEMKLAEKPVCAANARTETWRFEPKAPDVLADDPGLDCFPHGVPPRDSTDFPDASPFSVPERLKA